MVRDRQLTEQGRLVFEETRQLLREACRDYLPDTCYDFHAHLYHDSHASDALPAHLADETGWVGLPCWRESLSEWFPPCPPEGGLFFAYPKQGIDRAGANNYVASQIASDERSRALLLVAGDDDPHAIEQQLNANDKLVGFKVYHCYADRSDTMSADPGEFLPEWLWQLAHSRGLLIMLHLVKRLALADPANQTYLIDHCTRYPNAKLILAHAGRGFCAEHTVRGIKALRHLDNLYFDTSAICESPPFDTILRHFGPQRLLFGSDFPVSEMLGRAVSIGDQFIWLNEQSIRDCSAATVHPTLVGMESLQALITAFRSRDLDSSDVELVMRGNARRLLNLHASSLSLTDTLYQYAKQLIPGGTQLLSKRPEMFAPTAWPAYYREARGCTVTDLDGRHFLDFSTSGIGSCLLGFADPDVNAAVTRRILLGSMCSQNAPEEVALAERLLAIHPWADCARFTRTGGEANAAAIRVARAATGRDIVAFCGYHGWSDWYLATNLTDNDSTNDHSDDRLKAHLLPGLAPMGVPSCLAGTALPFNYNHLDELEHIVNAHGNQLAAVIMEPFRFTDPAPGFLQGVRQLCNRCGAVLIFDEITSGWRFNHGGYHLSTDVTPDMAVFAKSMSNGFPMAAIIGIRAVMEAFQNTFVSSTYWTEALGPVAALATINKLETENVATYIATIGQEFRQRLRDLAISIGLPLSVTGKHALQHIHFDCADANSVGTLFTIELLKRGILSGAGFYPTLAHRGEHMERYMTAASEALRVVADAVESNQVEARLPGGPRQTGFARLVR